MKKLPPKPPKSMRKAPATPVREGWTYSRQGHYDMAMADTYVPMWRDVLKRVGWPTDVVVLDFENYFTSDYSLRRDDMSTIEYIMDDRYEELCVSILKVKGEAPFVPKQAHCWVGEDNIAMIFRQLKEEYGENLERCTLVIQNARFDGMILCMKHDITPQYVVDVLGLAMAWNTWSKNGLDDLCKRFNLPSKGDTSQFKGMSFKPRWETPKKGRKKIAPPPKKVPTPTKEQVTALCEYANNDAEREWDLFTILLPLLSRPEVELPLMRHTLSMYYEPILEVDYDRAEELLVEMEAEMMAAVEPTGLSLPEIRGGVWDETMFAALKDAGDVAHDYTKPANNCKRGWKIASGKADEQRELLLNHADETVAGLMRAKAAVGSWPNHMSRIRRIVAQCKAAGGKLPVPLFYHGAHTGRWSGGEKINLQNLGSRGHPLVNAIRELLIAPEGWSLVIADLAAVEARGVAWIADELGLIEKFKAGEEIYCRLAEEVLEVKSGSLRKPRKTDPPGIAKQLKKKRGLGKTGVLGCGYGMGAAKAEAYAVSMGAGEIGPELAKKVVDTYRSSNPNIVKFWKDIEKAFIYATKYDTPVELRHGLKVHTEVEPNSKAKVTVITLPSGRELKYHNVSIVAGQYGEEIRVYNAKEHKRVRVWGGHLTENVVQAFCRDALAEAVLTLAEKYNLPLSVHDEVILCVPDEVAAKAETETVEVMSRSPAWGPDFPLDAESVVSKRYGDH